MKEEYQLFRNVNFIPPIEERWDLRKARMFPQAQYLLQFIVSRNGYQSATYVFQPGNSIRKCLTVVSLTTSILNTIIHSFIHFICNESKIVQASYVFNEMGESSFSNSLVTLNTLINRHCKKGHMGDA